MCNGFSGMGDVLSDPPTATTKIEKTSWKVGFLT